MFGSVFFCECFSVGFFFFGCLVFWFLQAFFYDFLLFEKYLPYFIISLSDRLCHSSSSLFSRTFNTSLMLAPTFFLTDLLKSLIISVNLHNISLNAAIPFLRQERGHQMVACLKSNILHRKTGGVCVCVSLSEMSSKHS